MVAWSVLAGHMIPAKDVKHHMHLKFPNGKTAPGKRFSVVKRMPFKCHALKVLAAVVLLAVCKPYLTIVTVTRGYLVQAGLLVPLVPSLP